MIHKTAVIDSKAKISENVKIGPYSVIGPHVEIGEGTVVQSHVNITGQTNKKAYISLLGYSPKTDMFETIVPNPFEPVMLVEGNFQIPSMKNSQKYALDAIIPQNDNRDEVAEFMVLLVTKKKTQIFLNE